MEKNEATVYVQASFDYSHFLPEHDRCFPLHGHTSLARMEVCGSIGAGGMVIDFGDAKRVLSEVLSAFDHKLVTNRRYCKAEGGRIIVSHGNYAFALPADQVCILDGEGTCENINDALLGLLAARMPDNATSISLEISEGANKGSRRTRRLRSPRWAEL